MYTKYTGLVPWIRDGLRSDFDGKSLHKTTVSVPLGCPDDTFSARPVSFAAGVSAPRSCVLGRAGVPAFQFCKGKADQKQDKVSCEDAEDVEGKKTIGVEFFKKSSFIP